MVPDTPSAVAHGTLAGHFQKPVPNPIFFKKILKVLKLATSTSALDREHGYLNSFTLCRGRTLYTHDMFRFDASAGSACIYTIP